MIKIADILKFFKIDPEHKFNGVIRPKSLNDYLKTLNLKETKINLLELNNICKKLENEGYLKFTGTQGRGVLMNETYYCFSYNEELANYGSYEYLVYGFPLIRSDFINSVRPIEIIYLDDTKPKQYDIGTCFMISETGIITSKHCLPKNSIIKIENDKGEIIKAVKIIIHNDPNIDLALIIIDNSFFKNYKFFKLGNANVLEDVLTMGYPPIPGFDGILVTETANITTEIKSTLGKIVAREFSYLDKQNYFLINARVKGGNSGGPLINKKGEVVGVITQLPMESNELDSLGYGVVTPSMTLLGFMQKIGDNHDDIKFLKFENIEEGIRLL